MNERWVTAAATSDAMVAELLLRLKQSSSSDSPPLAAASTSLNPIGWGERKSRSKPSTATTIVSGKRQLQRSPSTPLSWSGGGPSTSDGDDESSRPSDLYEGDRSVKIDLHQKPKKENGGFIGKSNELEIENRKRWFVLPDLNQIPVYEDMELS